MFFLYAIHTGDHWIWGFSQDLRADVSYWSEYCSDLCLAVLRPAFTIGQAIEVTGKLQSWCAGDHGRAAFDGIPFAQKNSIVMTSSDQKLLYQSLKPSLTIIRKYTGSGKVAVRFYNRSELAALGMLDWKLDPSVYTRLIESLSGRQLLMEELVSLSEHMFGKPLDDWSAYIQYGMLSGKLIVATGMSRNLKRKFPQWWRKEPEYTCLRCGSGMEKMRFTKCAICGENCPYCEACLTMGRVRYCSPLVLGVDTGGALNHQPLREHSIEEWIQPWGLSPAQAEAVRSGLRWLQSQSEDGEDHAVCGKMQGNYSGGWVLGQIQGKDGGKHTDDGRTQGTADDGHKMQKRVQGKDGKWGTVISRLLGANRGRSLSNRESAPTSNFLIWAVTGAGKTEMIFPFIAYTLARGGKALIATPRRDVVLELRPRIMRAFPDAAVVTLYGGSEQRWDHGSIAIATTHQLLRFHEAFDLVVIDELDAFPYHGDPMLQFAARRACKPDGRTLMLSATPPGPLRRAAVRGKLPHVKVPARYHGYPLPIPRQLAMPPLPQVLQAGAVPPALMGALRASLARGAQLFVFVPNIATVEPLARLLRQVLPAAPEIGAVTVDGTSSKDPDRADKVQRFRDGHIRVLVTTTILERGVTVPRTDVFILGADSRLFDEAALVQMSGRAGRSKDDPAGRVFFAAQERTRSQADAISHIKEMNRIARQKGFLHAEKKGA